MRLRQRWGVCGEILGMDGRALTQGTENGQSRAQEALTARKFSAAD